jgi:hypothetical protein
MDIRQLLNKLDRVALSEAISLKDVEAAVAGIKDEQERAAKLNDLAWNNKLPGLYDPVSGYFVAKQSQPNSMGGSYNISATASSGADKQLADMGLVPQNAKTSTGLGRMFRGDDKGEYDKQVKGTSDKVVSDKQAQQIKAQKLPQLTDLVKKLQSITGGSTASNATANTTLGPKMSTEGIFESLMREFQDVVGDMPMQEQLSPEAKAVADQINALIDELETLADDPEVRTAIDNAKKTVADIEASEKSKYDAKMDTELDAASAEADKVAADTKSKADALAKVGGTDGITSAGNNQIKQTQEQLKALNIDPGPIDGKMGPKTIAGIKAFQQMAGIAADGKIGPDTIKALADGKNIVARSQLTQSLTAIEALVTKYKISESVTEQDVLMMTEEEARKFVMKNIKYFSESEQIGIMRDYLSEAPTLALPGPGGNRLPAVSGGGNLPAVAGRPAVGNPNVIDVPFKDVTPKPSWGQRALSFAKGLGKKGTGLAVAAAGALGLGGLVAAFSGKDIKMDPADLAELQKHLKVLDQYGKDPAVKGGLPADVQKRLDGVLVKLDKLKKVQGAAPAAAPGTAPAPAAGGGNTMDGF